jgi:4'-phosphopantetheinyl transferase
MISRSLEPMVAFPPIACTMTGHAVGLAPVDGTVDVWSFTLQEDAVAERVHSWLGEEERSRAARFLHREHRIRYTLAHAGLRAVLSRYVSQQPVALRIQIGPTGKPILLDHQGRPHALRFNLSHSHVRMLVAVATGREVGVDLERIRETIRAGKLAERFYAPTEYEQVKRRAGFDQAREFYRYWVAKEAVLKGQAIGLEALQRCEIVPTDSLSTATIRVSQDATMQHDWSIQWLNCGCGWEGAVSASGSNWSVRVIDEWKPD